MSLKTITSAVAIAGALALSGCANSPLTRVIDTYNALSDLSIPYSTISIGINAFVAAERTAKNYIVYCTPNPAPIGCDDVVIKTKLDPAIKSGRSAANALLAFYKAHPGALGSKGLYDALIAATNVITSIEGSK